LLESTFAAERVELQLQIVDERKAATVLETELKAANVQIATLEVAIGELREELRAASPPPPPTPTSAPPPDEDDDYAGEVGRLQAELQAWKTNAGAAAAKHASLMEEMTDQFVDLEDKLAATREEAAVAAAAAAEEIVAAETKAAAAVDAAIALATATGGLPPASPVAPRTGGGGGQDVDDIYIDVVGFDPNSLSHLTKGSSLSISLPPLMCVASLSRFSS
jgi:hypothetical protein